MQSQRNLSNHSNSYNTPTSIPDSRYHQKQQTQNYNPSRQADTYRPSSLHIHNKLQRTKLNVAREPSQSLRPASDADTALAILNSAEPTTTRHVPAARLTVRAKLQYVASHSHAKHAWHAQRVAAASNAATPIQFTGCEYFTGLEE